jgi:hypothetical protein
MALQTVAAIVRTTPRMIRARFRVGFLPRQVHTVVEHNFRLRSVQDCLNGRGRKPSVGGGPARLRAMAMLLSIARWIRALRRGGGRGRRPFRRTVLRGSGFDRGHRGFFVLRPAGGRRLLAGRRLPAGRRLLAGRRLRGDGLPGSARSRRIRALHRLRDRRAPSHEWLRENLGRRRGIEDDEFLGARPRCVINLSAEQMEKMIAIQFLAWRHKSS